MASEDALAGFAMKLSFRPIRLRPPHVPSAVAFSTPSASLRQRRRDAAAASSFYDDDDVDDVDDDDDEMLGVLNCCLNGGHSVRHGRLRFQHFFGQFFAYFRVFLPVFLASNRSITFCKQFVGKTDRKWSSSLSFSFFFLEILSVLVSISS